MILAALLASALVLSAAPPQGGPPEDQDEGPVRRTGPKASDYPQAKDLPKPGEAQTCPEQCAALKQMVKGACERKHKGSPSQARACMDTTGPMVQTCMDSCDKKGTLDKNYMKTHMPKPPKPQHNGPKPKGAGGPGEDAASAPE